MNEIMNLTNKNLNKKIRTNKTITNINKKSKKNQQNNINIDFI